MLIDFIHFLLTFAHPTTQCVIIKNNQGVILIYYSMYKIFIGSKYNEIYSYRVYTIMKTPFYDCHYFQSIF